jgi:drug/metabolite transporter (DMT)-like permease
MRVWEAWALAPALAAGLWGGMYVVSKWGFDAIPPVTLAFCRVALGAAVLLLLVRVRYPARGFSRRDWLRFGALGLVVAVSLATQFVGTDLTTASEGALLTVLTPVFTFILGVRVLNEPITRRRVFGMALAFLGTGLVVAGQYDLAALGGGSGLGIILLVVASLTFAGYTVWGAPLIRRYSAFETVTYSTAIAVPLLALGVPVEWYLTVGAVPTMPVTLSVLAAVGYLGVFSTAVAWYCWYKGLEFVDAGTVAIFFFAQPVVGAVLGALFLGDRFAPGFVVGGGLMGIGIYLVSTDAGIAE